MTPPERIVFSTPGRGILQGVIPARKSGAATAGPEAESEIIIIEDGRRGAPEKFSGESMQGTVKIEAPWLGIQIEGEIDDRIKGTPQAVLDDLKQQLSDPSRGVTSELLQEGAGSRPGWQSFKIILQFE